jgi:signal peptidase I
MLGELGYNSRIVSSGQDRRQADALRMADQGTQMQADEQPRPRVRSVLRELVETVLLTLLIYVLVRHFLFENYMVVGHSMDTTLEDEQYLVVSKLAYRLHDPQRGDIIVFRDPKSSDRKLIKRVIGLPGEVLEIRQGQVFIDQQQLDEPYITNPGRYSVPPTPIPADHYYVLGDNRNNSSDSHNWGTLSSERIVGKAWLSYWPPHVWGLVSHEIYGLAP